MGGSVASGDGALSWGSNFSYFDNLSPTTGGSKYGSFSFDASRAARTAAETRPASISSYLCIKY
jgi:hypothetical protein